MASCSTGRWVDTSPYVQLIVNEKSSNADSVTLSWTLQYVAEPIYGPAYVTAARDYSVSIDGTTVKTGTFSIGGKTGTITITSGTKTVPKTHAARSVSFGCSFEFALTWGSSYAGTRSGSGSINIGAKTSYTISYDLNGGAGSFSSQKKWHGEDITLHGHSPTRTGYIFGGWSLTKNGSFAYGAGYGFSLNESKTLYAIWTKITYSVTFDANGGELSGSSTATKTYDEALTLPSATRENYRLLGWSISSTATSATYTTSYTANESAILYAVWELAYVKPTITNYTVYRCDENETANDNGTYAIVKFDWSTYFTATSIVIDWGSGTKTITPTGNSGSVNEKIGNGDLSIEFTYTIIVTVSDGEGPNYSSSYPQSLGSAHFIIDIAPGGKGIAFGGAAETDGFNVKMDADFTKELKIHGISLVDYIYPIGSIYLSVSETNPQVLFGGTWERVKDTFLLASGDTYIAGATGGEATVTLDKSHIPTHYHDVQLRATGYDGWNSYTTNTHGVMFNIANTGDVKYLYPDKTLKSAVVSGYATTGDVNGTTTHGQPHNNMPPYLAVYVWKRTA